MLWQLFGTNLRCLLILICVGITSSSRNKKVLLVYLEAEPSEVAGFFERKSAQIALNLATTGERSKLLPFMSRLDEKSPEKSWMPELRITHHQHVHQTSSPKGTRQRLPSPNVCRFCLSLFETSWLQFWRLTIEQWTKVTYHLRHSFLILVGLLGKFLNTLRTWPSTHRLPARVNTTRFGLYLQECSFESLIPACCVRGQPHQHGVELRLLHHLFFCARMQCRFYLTNKKRVYIFTITW